MGLYDIMLVHSILLRYGIVTLIFIVFLFVWHEW